MPMTYRLVPVALYQGAPPARVAEQRTIRQHAPSAAATTAARATGEAPGDQQADHDDLRHDHPGQPRRARPQRTGSEPMPVRGRPRPT